MTCEAIFICSAVTIAIASFLFLAWLIADYAKSEKQFLELQKQFDKIRSTVISGMRGGE